MNPFFGFHFRGYLLKKIQSGSYDLSLSLKISTKNILFFFKKKLLKRRIYPCDLQNENSVTDLNHIDSETKNNLSCSLTQLTFVLNNRQLIQEIDGKYLEKKDKKSFIKNLFSPKICPSCYYLRTAFK